MKVLSLWLIFGPFKKSQGKCHQKVTKNLFIQRCVICIFWRKKRALHIVDKLLHTINI